MRLKKAVYYESENAQRPVEEFLNSLNNKTKAKILARIDFLEEHWHELRRPYIDIIEDGLWELRIQFARSKVRVIYAYMFRDYIILLHGFFKTTGSIPQADKLAARKRMLDFQRQYDTGMLKLKTIE